MTEPTRSVSLARVVEVLTDNADYQLNDYNEPDGYEPTKFIYLDEAVVAIRVLGEVECSTNHGGVGGQTYGQRFPKRHKFCPDCGASLEVE